MKRLLLLVLSALLVIPAIVVAMNKKPPLGIPATSLICQGVTPDNDKVITHTDGHQYTLFYFYDSVYAYQVVKHSTTNEDIICVFDSLNEFTMGAKDETNRGNARCVLTKNDFDTVRKIAAQREDLQKSFDLTHGQTCQAKKWLSQETFTKYQNILKDQIAAHDDSSRTAFVMGGRWQAFEKNYEQLINQTHTDLMRDIHRAKLQFYQLICVGIALVISGIYAGYQWYFGTQSEDDHDENDPESTTDTTEITQKPS
jgi:hypothetical protein